jgi:hypothetical protein
MPFRDELAELILRTVSPLCLARPTVKLLPFRLILPRPTALARPQWPAAVLNTGRISFFLSISRLMQALLAPRLKSSTRRRASRYRLQCDLWHPNEKGLEHCFVGIVAKCRIDGLGSAWHFEHPSTGT